MGQLTVELVATYGVMAGCKPEHMPLLLAIIEAFKNPSVDWQGATTTTAATVPVMIISGPILDKLGIGYSSGELGSFMNKTHGDSVNVTAAEMAVKTTGRYCRCIWMPTYQSAWDASHHGTKGVPVLDGGGKVLPDVVKVMISSSTASKGLSRARSRPFCPLQQKVISMNSVLQGKKKIKIHRVAWYLGK